MTMIPACPVEIATLDIGTENLRNAEGARFHLNYTLRATRCEPESLAMIAPAGSVEHVSCSAASDARVSDHGDMSIVEFTRAAGARFDDATIQLRLRWDDATRRALKGSPICVMPTALPQLFTAHGPYLMKDFTDPEVEAEEQRLILSTPLPAAAGTVTDQDGVLLMLALPTDRRFAETVWHADESVVLGGELLRTGPLAHRVALRDTLHGIHHFLGEELGQADRVRALVVCDPGADDYVSEFGQFLALDERFLMTTPEARASGERLMARNLASIWWRYGVRPAGRQGPAVGMGLSQYSAMRWFAAAGKQKELAAELDSAKRIIHRLESSGATETSVLLRGMRIALALYEGSTRSHALRDELRRWFAEDWGRAVPVSTLAKRLERIDVWLPK